jgi:hypothetical protein
MPIGRESAIEGLKMQRIAFHQRPVNVKKQACAWLESHGKSLSG